MPMSKTLFTQLQRQFSSLSPIPSKFSKIPSKYKPKAIKEAQQAVTDYLHSTRSVPYAYAEQISKNAVFSLSNLVSNVHFSVCTYSNEVKRLLRYNPINEFEFFYESIGIDYNDVRRFLPSNKFFFGEDERVLRVAFELCAFGFPWNRLGMLYEVESAVFSKSVEELRLRLCGFKEEYGFGNTLVVGICLVFPFVLEGELGGEIDGLLDDLKRVFVDFELGRFVEGNVDAWLGVCRKIKVFYDLGFEKGKAGDLMGEGKRVFVDYSFEVLVQKVEYFCKFGVRKKDVGLLILQSPEVLDYDLEGSVISIVGLLKHFGLGAKELASVNRMYPHVLGRNRMVNLPHVMRAMDLHVWFFDKIKGGNHQLLASYAMSHPDEDVDEEFKDCLEKIQVSRTSMHTMNKVAFLHGIGFGENAMTIKVLAHTHGTSTELQERFDCLLRAGLVFSELCMMIRTVPKILNQKPEILERKVNFLCEEMGCSLQDLCNFPAYLCFNLENRIKPRYRFHVWLAERGLCMDKYSIASIIATSDKNFTYRISRVDPAAPKYWAEFSSNKEGTHE